MNVIWAPLAERRALEAVEFIQRERPTTAVAWLEGLLTKVASLDRLAMRGRVVPEIGRRSYRELLHRPYRVIYRIDAGHVVILTLRHERRAWDASELGADG